MQIIQIDINNLKPYKNNAKMHPQKQIDQIAESIKAFGFNVPILVDANNTIIAGHGRYFAAKKLKMDTIPAILIDHLTEAQKRAFIIADNKLNLNTSFDMDILKSEFEAMQDELDDLTLTGFTQEELDELFPEKATDKNYLTDPDDIPEPPETPVCRLGDIWQLNNHRLMCGDSTDEESVKLLMNGEKADVLFTDPPYGINITPQRKTHEKILNDNLEDSDFNHFLDIVFNLAFSVMKPDTYAFIWTGWKKIGAFEKSIQKIFKIQALHIWVKNNFGIGYYSRPKHEPFYLCINGKPIYPEKAPADVWEAKKVYKTLHSCEKPVDLIINILDAYHKNSVILDLFLGSGSTLIAAEKTNRTCYGMELEPKYCDVIIKRWEDFTGQKAVHVDTNKTLLELKAMREADND